MLACAFCSMFAMSIASLILLVVCAFTQSAASTHTIRSVAFFILNDLLMRSKGREIVGWCLFIWVGDVWDGGGVEFVK